MAPALLIVREQMDVFLRGGPFAPFWQAVMDATASVDAAALTGAERQWYNDVYDLVYMAAEDPVDRENAADGILGVGELRAQLRPRGLDRVGAQPA